MVKGRVQLTLLLASAAIALALAILSFLYFSGHPAVVTHLCRSGLPNTTVAKRFRQRMISECVIYGEKQRFSGIQWSNGFEGFGFFPHRFTEEAVVQHGFGYPGINLISDAQSYPEGLIRKFPF